MQPIQGTHDVSLVILSFIIAFMASLTTLDTARRVNFATGWQKKLWLIIGSAAMGFGIWAMHFIGMLALELPVPIYYDVFLVVISILVAIAGAFFGLYYSFKSRMSNLHLLIGGTIMGLGISGMHYIGMMSMEGVHLIYDPLLCAISIIIAIGASIIALMLAFQYRKDKKGIGSQVKLVSGMVMGSAIAGMHYMGMAAVTFMPTPNSVEKIVSSLDIYAMVIPITISTIVILGIMLVISLILDKSLAEEIAFNEAILESVLDCLIIIDSKGNIIESNPTVTQIFGYSQEEIRGQNMERQLLLDSSISGTGAPSIFTASNGSIVCNQRFEVTGVQYDGTKFPIELTITKVKKEGAPIYTVYIRDITNMKESEKVIRQMAYHDALTGLPNRRFFNEHLNTALKEAEAFNMQVGVLFLDLDRFKIINDSMGHTFGDLVLKKVAENLQKSLGNKGVVARNGGDEFTVVLVGTSEEETAKTAQKIIDSLVAPFYLQGQEMFITTSIGIAMYPKDGQNQETLVKNADMAMYEAKNSGRNGYLFYEQRNGIRNSDRLHLENELRLALERDEFIVYYQPRLRIHTGEIIGVEALIRWNHPEKGIVSPDQFIPQAEESGLIIPIGDWILRTTVSQCKEWQENLFPCQISVNLSALQFQKTDIVKTISEVLDDVGLDPSLLNLEITENMMMDATYSTQVLSRLKKIGVHISIDDFGTGYNSLSQLKKLPIDHIKIDKSFIQHVTTDPENAAIVKAIISIAHSLHLNVIAEGVEDKDQFSFLKELQCHEMQGYLLSPPVPAKELEKLIVSGVHI